MANLVSFQSSLSSGELSPALYGRTDVAKWRSGTSTCRNFFVDYRGGVTSRPGFEYIGTAKQCGNTNPPRLIPFQFNINQGFILEFGHQYTRFIFDGAYITETEKTITGVSKADPALITIPNHGYSVGDWIFINDISGTTELNSLTWVVGSVVDSNTVTLLDLFGRIVDTTNYTTYTSGGTAARIYTVDSPYNVEDLPYLKYTQSADVMSLTCVNTETSTEYPPYSLERHSNTDWVFTQDTFTATISPPTNVTATALASNTLTTYYSYVVTAVSADTGEESNPSDAVSIQNCDISIYQGTNSISWDAVEGASSYNIYAATPSYGIGITAGNLYGYIGTSTGTNFNDNNLQPDFTIVPPQHFDPFARSPITDVVVTAGGTNYSQDTVGWSITTSTGSGFDGEPIVTNGSISGFVITNQGSGYADTDTITFTDSGGGVAKGTFTFGANPGDATTIIFNSHTFQFINYSHQTVGPNQIRLGNTLALTLQALANYLNASTDINLSCSTYEASSTVLTITYKTSGSIGNSYTLGAGSSGATPSGATLTGGGTLGSGATATLTIGSSTGTYPSTVGYYQQRRVYAGSLNKPDTYWMSQPGLYNNMDTSVPTTDADSITGNPWAQQVNGIQWLVPMPNNSGATGLVILTGKSAWQVTGGTSAAITPSNQTAVAQAYNGCSALVSPITINYDILYVQSKGSIVRDLQYSFYLNIYTGTDLTVYSDHLFLNNQIVDWAWAEEPFKLLWLVRDDGTLLCLTYLKESNGYATTSEVFAWTRHDSNGLFYSVATVTEPPTDALYAVVKRYVLGAWRYYIERLSDRLWVNVEQAFCVDAGLRSNLPTPDATLQPGAVSGTGVEFTTDTAVFTIDDVGSVIRGNGGIATITNYNSTTSVTCDITSDFSVIIPNNPDNMVAPITSGNWSITPPVSNVYKLNHLEGLEVAILADGSVVNNQTITEVTPGNFGISLDVDASNIVVGLPYVCQVQTMYMDVPNQEGQSVQGKRKTISQVNARLEFTRGLQMGADQPDSATQQNYAPVTWSNMIELKDRTMATNAGNAVPLYTGDKFQAVTAGWDPKGQIAFQQVYPLPAKILALTAFWVLGDDR